MTAEVLALPAPVRDELIKSDKGIIRACEHNALTLINASSDYLELHYDDFYARIRVGARDWTDADDVELLCWLQQQHRVHGFTIGQVRHAIRAVAYRRRQDALINFVVGLDPWDGTERVATAFCDGWGARLTHTIACASSNFFVALIARALHPGAQVDTVWTFEGAQGIGKSKALRALGGEFHAEISAPIGSADFMRELRGVWIAELSELDSLRGREASTIKRLLSAPEDRFVQKYALHAERYPRRAVAVATTNEADYWQDATGARRLIPIRCGEIRDDLIAKNRLQWLAEARDLFNDGATWWSYPADLAAEQEERQDVDPWEDVLRDLIANGRQTGMDGHGREPWPEGWISTATIMRDWLRLPANAQGRASGVRLGRVMRRLGFLPQMYGKQRERGWAASTPDTGPGEVLA